MQPSSEMQSFVNACEFRHKTYIDIPGDRLKMKLNDEDLPLVFERLSASTFRVAHERLDSDGQLVSDPEVIFFTGYEKWIAMEISQPLSLVTEIGRRRSRAKYVELNGSETAVKEYKVSGQKALADFVKKWVQALRSRGWHEDSTNAAFRQGRFNERGEVESILHDMADQDRRDGVTTTFQYKGKSYGFTATQGENAKDVEEVEWEEPDTEQATAPEPESDGDSGNEEEEEDNPGLKMLDALVDLADQKHLLNLETAEMALKHRADRAKSKSNKNTAPAPTPA